MEHSTWTDRTLKVGDALFIELAGCAGRYHAPMGRLVIVGKLPPGTEEIDHVCLEAFEKVFNPLQSFGIADFSQRPLSGQKMGMAEYD